MSVAAAAFVAHDARSRRFLEAFVVRLGDTDVEGRWRLDGVARALQDVASDDWRDAGADADETWVVRRTRLRAPEGAYWPRYLDDVTLATWCSGTGAAWAERRTDVLYHGEVVLGSEALWVSIDPAGHPIRLRDGFFDVYGESVRERKVPGGVETPSIPEGAHRRPWVLRRADLDIVGHVNNAAVWEALAEVASAPCASVSVTHHGAIEPGDDVTLVSSAGAMWLVVEGSTRVSATY